MLFISKRAAELTKEELEKEEAAKLAETDPDKFFYYDLHQKYPELGKSAAAKLIETDPDRFFYYNLRQTYLELGKSAAAKLIEVNLNRFFDRNLHQKYPELGKSAAAKLIETDPDKFFYYDLHQTYPEAGKSAAAKLIETNSNKFFDRNLHQTYPELGKSAAAKLIEVNLNKFFDRNLHQTYPELGKSVVAKLIETNPDKFFYYKLYQTYPELGKSAAAKLIEVYPDDFFYYDLHQKYPEVGKSAAAKLAEVDLNRFFDRNLHQKYPEVGKSAAAKLAEVDLNRFFDRNLHQKYPEVGKSAAAKLIETDPDKFFYFDLHQKYPEVGKSAAAKLIEVDLNRFFNRNLHQTYPELGKSAAAKLIEVNLDDFFYYKLHQTYPELITEQMAKTLAYNSPALYLKYELNLDPRFKNTTLSVIEGITIAESLRQQYTNKQDPKSDNFASLTVSQFQDQQRPKEFDQFKRYDFAINNPLKFDDNLESKILSSIYHQETSGLTHQVGIPGSTKSFALVSFPNKRTLVAEEIQSDLPPILSELKEKEEEIKARHGEENYLNFIRNATEHAATYPAIVIGKLAEFADQNRITKIMIPDADYIVEIANIQNRFKADRIYDKIPTKLGFKLEGNFMVYTGDMKTLSSNAKQLEETIKSGLYKSIAKQPKQTAAPKNKKLVDLDVLKPQLQAIINDRILQLNLTEDFGQLMNSIALAQKNNIITNKEKNQLIALVVKQVKAALNSMWIKVAGFEGMNYISKRAKVLDKPRISKRQK